MNTQTTSPAWIAEWFRLGSLYDTATYLNTPDMKRLMEVEVEVNGAAYTVATNGYVLLAREGSMGTAPVPPAKKDKLVQYLTEAPPAWHSLDADELRGFAGEPQFPHHCECKHCDWSDEDTTLPDRREGWVGPALLDINLLAQVLSVVPAGEIAVGFVPWAGENAHRVLLRGDGWRAMIAGLRPISSDFVSAPRFPLPEGVA